MNEPAPTTEAEPVAATRRWLERAVIGLNLCPFAKSVHVKKQVRMVLSDAETPEDLLEQLAEELLHLRDISPERTDTTLLIHPQVLTDFLEYNDFLDRVDALLEALDLPGTLQVASFHPDYQFADSYPDDIENYTNRSPYPTLHLIRETSIDRAVAAFADPEAIVGRNKESVRTLGVEGWQKLLRDESTT
ncbi:MAG: DUF1415 domain-containing protein [Xanthomonadaceae bacterium]|jgi:hypothetical protein|nr:DUF1415 domain-containing protein [Xanthomonadaceae bacterium]